VAPWLIGLLVLDTASLLVLQLAQELGSSFQAGRVALTGMWAAIAAVGVLAGKAGSRRSVWYGGLALLALTTADLVLFEMSQLPGGYWATASLLVAAALVVCALGDGLRAAFDPGWVALVASPLSALLAFVGLLELTEGELAGSIDAQGLALLALAAVYGLLAALVYGLRRNLSSLLWLQALVIALVATPLLVSGNALVASLAVGSVLIALIARGAGEPRLLAASLAPFLGALGVTLALQAPPKELFVEQDDLWSSLLALALCAAALVSLTLLSAPLRSSRPDAFDPLIEQGRSRYRLVAPWLIGLLVLDTMSVGALAVVSSLDGSFENAQAALSAVWALAALACLTIGLLRSQPVLRAVGFGLVGLTLVKIFLYDLSSLDPVARALSFLAVGAVLLVAGFFYQRLAGERRPPKPPSRRPPASPASGEPRPRRQQPPSAHPA